MILNYPTDLFQIGKGVHQGCMLSTCLFNLYGVYIMRNAGWKKHKLESRLPGEKSITKICRWHHPYDRMRRRTKEPLDESERGQWTSWLKTQLSKNQDHGIWSHHFMASRGGNNGYSGWLYFSGLLNHCRCWLQPWN